LRRVTKADLAGRDGGRSGRGGRRRGRGSTKAISTVGARGRWVMRKAAKKMAAFWASCSSAVRSTVGVVCGVTVGEAAD